MDNHKLNSKIEAECRRIEEDAEHSFKSHFNAAEFWGNINLLLGLPAAILGAVAGGTSAVDGAQATVISTAWLASALVTCLTFLKPGEKSDSHKNAGCFYQSLRNNTRIFREIDLVSEPDQLVLRRHFAELVNRRDDLNATMPSIPKSAYEKARKDIEAGRASYIVDKEVENDSQ